MEINKTYDITELGNKVQEAIESCVAGKSNRCSIDLLTANEILEVLRETKTREERHQTLESALSFVEKEDGTQTNEMELYNNKPDCFGNYYTEECKQCNNVDCNCRIECREKPECYCESIPPDDVARKCSECKLYHSCTSDFKEERNKTKPDCFGQYMQNETWEICEECEYEIPCSLCNEGDKTNG